MPTMTVKNAAGTDEVVEKPNVNGRAAAAASRPVALSTEDKAALDARASETTLAAILAKIIAAPATEAKLIEVKAAIEAVTAKLIAAPATEATQVQIKSAIDAITAKLIAAPATEAAQTAGNTTLTAIQTALGSLGTQATLAAILAKIIAAPATEAKQDAGNTLLTTIAGYLDGVEALIGSTNTSLGTLGGYLDTVEALLAAATPAGENFIGKVGGVSAVATATITRPADTTAYASGDLVAASTTAAMVNGAPTSFTAARANGGTGVIRRARLSTTKTGLAGSDVFRIHLFKTAPTVTNGDNGALIVNGVAAGALGFVDVTLSSVFNDGAKGYAVTDIVFDTPGGAATLFALIEARGAYTPASGETFGLAFEILRD